jgi:hypothetical protein
MKTLTILVALLITVPLVGKPIYNLIKANEISPQASLKLKSIVRMKGNKIKEIFENSADDDKDNTEVRELVFQSGYENSVIGTPADAHADIVGIDKMFSEKNDWVKDLETHEQFGKFFIYYEGGNSSQRYARIIDEPGNPTNKILHFWLNEAYAPYGNNQLKGRIQASLSGNNLYEMTLKHKLYLPKDMEALKNSDQTFQWLTIQEFWNDKVDSDYPFRISINIVKPTAAHDLRFEVTGQTKRTNEEAWDDVWRVEDDSFSIPIGQWFTLETYFKEGNKDMGKFSVSVTDQAKKKFMVVDMTNFTYHPEDPTPDGLNNFNPMKLYAPARLINPMQALGKTLQLYWDDFELRIGR